MIIWKVKLFLQKNIKQISIRLNPANKIRFWEKYGEDGLKRFTLTNNLFSMLMEFILFKSFNNLNLYYLMESLEEIEFWQNRKSQLRLNRPKNKSKKLSEEIEDCVSSILNEK